LRGNIYNIHPDADLRGADLRGADLRGADLRVANLRGANLADADLRGANLRVANLLEANLTNTNFANADLTDADLTGAHLRNANLRGADLRVANLRGANLADADLRGANLADADLRGANLRGANLLEADLTDTDFTDADLTEADLTEADLRGANLRGADLTNAILRGTTLPRGYRNRNISELSEFDIIQRIDNAQRQAHEDVRTGINSEQRGMQQADIESKQARIQERLNRATALAQSVLSTTSQNDSEPTCSICQEPLNNGNTVVVAHDTARQEPKHLFHKDCLEGWCGNKNDVKCPLCNKNVKCEEIKNSSSRNIKLKGGKLKKNTKKGKKSNKKNTKKVKN